MQNLTINTKSHKSRFKYRVWKVYGDSHIVINLDFSASGVNISFTQEHIKVWVGLVATHIALLNLKKTHERMCYFCEKIYCCIVHGLTTCYMREGIHTSTLGDTL